MNSIEQAVTALRNSKLVAIPTETVYGLGGNASDPIAIQKIYTVKGRPMTNPLIIHIPNRDAIVNWAIDIPDTAWQLAEHYWPGPLTLILKRHPRVSTLVTGGQDTVALRIPNHPLTLELLRTFNGGIAAPSANRYGRISPTTADDVRAELGDAVDIILDGGPCDIGIESTIVSLVEPTPMILRQGHLTASMLTKTLSIPVMVHSDFHKNLVVPGSNESHYAPIQPLYLLEKNTFIKKVFAMNDEKKILSVLSFSPKPTGFDPNHIHWVIASMDPDIYAQQLYHQLRVFDETRSSCILVERPPTAENWAAVTDRLQRASSPLT